MRAYRVAYDGRGFYGFQRQPDVPTVEDAVFDALRELEVIAADADAPAGYSAAGRTDRGVSAVAQTMAFEAPEWLSPGALNSELPPAVRAWASASVREAFHATHHAEWREYTYHLHAPDGSPALAERAIETLSGEHDFSNLTPDDRGTERDLEASLLVDRPYFVIRLRADGFPRQLVRRLVGLVSEVAHGDRPFAAVERALAAEPLEGAAGIAPAAPEPLVLTGVGYPGVEFEVDEDAAAATREIVDRRRVDALTASRVADTILDGLGCFDG